MRKALVFLFCICHAWAYPQASDTWMISGAAGYSVIGENLRGDNVYHVGIVTLQLPVWTTTGNARGGISIHFEPMVGLGMTSITKMKDFEVGANVQFKGYWNIRNHVQIFVTAGTGPGYFSQDSQKQAKGFIFSNNFAAGASLPLTSGGSWYLIPQIRFRHASNLGIKEPNYGLDHFVFMLGIGRRVGKRASAP